MSALDKYLLRPTQGVRDAYMGIGGLLLILAVIAFAGADFTFDEARAAMLRPLGVGLAISGAVFWARASIGKPADNSGDEPPSS